MKKIFTFLGALCICLSSIGLYAETDTVTCTFFMYSKASVGCNVYTVYAGNAPVLPPSTGILTVVSLFPVQGQGLIIFAGILPVIKRYT